VRIQFGNGEIGTVATLALLDVHGQGKRRPHAIFPFQIILLHALVIIAFAPLADSYGSHTREILVDVSADRIIVFVRLVAETKNDILESWYGMLAVAELERGVTEILHELYGIVGRLALTVCSHDEEGCTVGWYLVEILKVIFLRITDERGKTKFRFGFLCETNGVFFRRAGLRAVKDDETLFLNWSM
jgi:hypothetical protein